MVAEEKKICILNPYLPTLGGGEKEMGMFCQFMEEYYDNAQIDILVHNYNEVDIHSPDYPTVDDLNRKFDLHLSRTKIVKVDLEDNNSLRARLRNSLKITKITKNYNLFCNNMFLSHHIGRAAFNIYCCMFPPRKYAEKTRNPIKKILFNIWDTFFYRSYQVFICNSQFTYHWLTRYWKESDKYQLRYPPVFFEKEIEGRYREDEKRNIILSVGRFFVAAHSKKQLEMLQFFLNHPDVFSSYEYHLVGSVSNDPQDLAYLEKIREMAASVNNVFIHENCSHDELIDLYGKTKVFWHATGYQVDEEQEPEKMEHFGITTVEAMSFGAVPVVINKGGQKETVVQGKTGFLWQDEAECVAYTGRLIQDDDLRKAMAAASHERARLFSTDEFYRRNRSIFDAYKL